MKVTVGRHCFRLPTFRVGFLEYFGLQDLKKIYEVEPAEAIREWIPREYAENLAKDLLAPDAEEGSVYITDGEGHIFGLEDLDLPPECSLINEWTLALVTFVCSRFFSVLDDPSLNRDSLSEFKKRHQKLCFMLPVKLL